LIEIRVQPRIVKRHDFDAPRARVFSAQGSRKRQTNQSRKTGAADIRNEEPETHYRWQP
jgi:hypothetical protein